MPIAMHPWIHGEYQHAHKFSPTVRLPDFHEGNTAVIVIALFETPCMAAFRGVGDRVRTFCSPQGRLARVASRDCYDICLAPSPSGMEADLCERVCKSKKFVNWIEIRPEIADECGTSFWHMEHEVRGPGKGTGSRGE